MVHARYNCQHLDLLPFCCSVTNATAWTGKGVAVTQSQESSQDVDPEKTRAVSSAQVTFQT